MDGPTSDDLEAIRAATFTVDAVHEREKITDHDVAAFVDVLSRRRRSRRSLDPLRPDVAPTSSTPRWRCRSARPARSSSPAPARSPSTLAAKRPRARPHRLRRSHPRRARRADHLRDQARRLRARGAPQRRAPRSRLRARSPSVRSPARSAPTPRPRPEFERRVLARLDLEAEAGLDPGRSRATATPSCCRRSASPAPGLERLATEIRHLQRTEVREAEEPFKKGQKGSSAMPHKRNPITTERITGLARVLRGYAQAARRERRALARARHQPLRRRARDPARRDDRAGLHAVAGDPRRRRPGRRTRTGCSRTSS